MAHYEVIVGNIGNVYSGSNKLEALKSYREYVEQSRSEHGRAAGESVIMMKDSEPVAEHHHTHFDISKFSSDDLRETVSYGKHVVAHKTRQGWTALNSQHKSVDKAVRSAIWSMPNDTLASELRREIVTRLEEEEGYSE